MFYFYFIPRNLNRENKLRGNFFRGGKKNAFNFENPILGGGCVTRMFVRSRMKVVELYDEM